MKVEILAPVGPRRRHARPRRAGRRPPRFRVAGASAARRHAPYRFRVTATRGAATVAATPLMRDRVEAVSTSGDRLKLETAAQRQRRATPTSRPSTDPRSPTPPDTQRTVHELPARPLGAQRHQPRTCRSSATTSPTPTPTAARSRAPSSPTSIAAALNGAGANRDRHRHHAGRGGAAVHAGQHHDHREPDGPGDQRRRLLPGHRRAADPPLYTRNGQFKVDRDGYIVNNGGLRLMGYRADGQASCNPAGPAALQLPTAGIEPVADHRGRRSR